MMDAYEVISAPFMAGFSMALQWFLPLVLGVLAIRIVIKLVG